MSMKEFEVRLSKRRCLLLDFNTPIPIDFNLVSNLKYEKFKVKIIDEEFTTQNFKKKKTEKEEEEARIEMKINAELSVNGLQKSFTGIEEKLVMENASYFVLRQTQNNHQFELLPVVEWVKLKPMIKYKTLNVEEAEIEYKKRSGMDLLTRQTMRIKLEGDEQENTVTNKIPKKKTKIRYNVDNDENDNFESAEVDYMSDSSEASPVPEAEKEKIVQKQRSIANDDLNEDINTNLDSYLEKYGEVTEEQPTENNDNKRNKQDRKRKMSKIKPNQTPEYEDDEDDDEDDDDDFDSIERKYQDIDIPFSVDKGNQIIGKVMDSKTTPAPITVNYNHIILDENRPPLERKIAEVLIHAVSLKPLTSSELMRIAVKIPECKNIEKSKLVKYVGTIIKDINFGREKINGVQHFKF